MNQRNYQKELDRKILKLQEDGEVPTLLIHSCCAPCSSYVLEYLSRYFAITVFYYNPNITELSEYQRRVSEQKRLIATMPVKYPVKFVEGPYEPEAFASAVKGFEHIPEGGQRCFQCFALRLGKAAEYAVEHGFDLFTTTLTISPLKNAAKLNEIGEQMAGKYGVEFLNSDFKKKNGYKRSVELSAEYGLYRQDYCGCAFSKRERELAKMQSENNSNF